MGKTIHLVKLSVGTKDIESLIQWQKQPQAQDKNGYPRHITRMWPKRSEEILNGGSIYWVIKGSIQCRQRIIRLDEIIDSQGIRHCAIILDHEIVRTTQANKRPFQGWRYLNPNDAPSDLGKMRENDDILPHEMAGHLADIGVL